jgi:hypothetical protein
MTGGNRQKPIPAAMEIIHVSQGIGKILMAEKASPDVPPYCAAFP